MKRVDLELVMGVNKSNIIIDNGLIDNCPELLSFLINTKHVNHFLITDENVDLLYSDHIYQQLGNIIKLKKIVIIPGEKSKTIKSFVNITNQILEFGVDKDSCIISLGGGMINNLAGFVASTIYRGINLIHIPTSLLAQVDAAIDFKQALNCSLRKNTIGSIYSAKLILIDPIVLKTLPVIQLRNGFAEIIKHALTQDYNFFKSLFIVDFSSENQLSSIIIKTIKLKVELVNDNSEFGNMVMQYGHQVGHAIESLSKYQLSHGEAISIGMCISAEISHLLGFIKFEDMLSHYEIFKRFKLPIYFPDFVDLKELWIKLEQDKYSEASVPKSSLLSSIGSLKIVNGSYEIPMEKQLLKLAIENNIRKK